LIFVVGVAIGSCLADLPWICLLNSFVRHIIARWVACPGKNNTTSKAKKKEREKKKRKEK
jgi:hypothetical protein